MVTPDAPLAMLRKQFGFDAFRPGQADVIDRLLAGRSALAIFPTGAGKSICYQLPALMMDGVTLVISPLIALMKDQIDFLKSKGIAAERLDSSLGLEEYRRVMSDLTGGTLKLLYIAPERLGSERFLQTLRRLKLAMMAIDEAHCISEWGHNFRPDYMKLANLAKALGVGRVLGLTATATPAVATDIAAAFGMEPTDVVKTPFHRKNLTLRVTPVERAGEGENGRGGQAGTGQRDRLLLDRVRSRPAGPTIVYVTLQKTAEDVAASLARSGLPARAYHAGMTADERNAVQDQFMASDRAIVVATIAFGMGIDKRDIRYVYHYNLPKSLENYAQEIGRAGRDGEASTCELLASYDDRIVLENFTFGDTPTGRAILDLLCEILTEPARGQGGAGDAATPPAPREADPFDVSTYDLSARNDVRPLVVDTVLTYLELDGLIASTGPFYNEYKFQPLRPGAQMLARFDADRQGFIRSILKCGIQGKTWWKLDLSQVMAATGADRGRIVAALNYLEEQGDMKLEVAGARQGYRMLRRDFDVKELARTMAQRFAEREARDTRRLATVLAFAAAQTCRTANLLTYFGEALSAGGDRCGHCDVCLGESAGPLTETPPRAIKPREREAIRSLKSQHHPALATPRQMARLLCGLNSPATTRAKLQSHAAFGLLADVPFAAVLAELKP